MRQLFFANSMPQQCPDCKAKKIADFASPHESEREPSWICMECHTYIYQDFLRNLLQDMNSREKKFYKARQLLSDEQLVAFFKSAQDKKVHAIKLINEKLDDGTSLDRIFYTGRVYGYVLSARKLSGSKFKISFGYALGDVGDGGEWKVEFNGNEVVLIEGNIRWMN